MSGQTLTNQELYSGLIRLHILHHAAEKPVYGLWIIEELARHGYRLSAGTLYPLLHSLERRGMLRSTDQRQGRRLRRLYRITPAGRRALRTAKQKVKELFGELFESELRDVFGHREHSRRQPVRDSGTAAERSDTTLRAERRQHRAGPDNRFADDLP